MSISTGGANDAAADIDHEIGAAAERRAAGISAWRRFSNPLSPDANSLCRSEASIGPWLLAAARCKLLQFRAARVISLR
jgi:hypothetical protein